MKHLHTITLSALLTLLCAFGATTLTSCSNDETTDDRITEIKLPTAARAFINAYFPNLEVVTAVRESVGDSCQYIAVLSTGTEITFGSSGDWMDVDAPKGQFLPKGFYPKDIDRFIATYCANLGINEIEREALGFDVELVDGAGFIFSEEGSLLGYND